MIRAPVSDGDVLAEKYRVERVLAVGGMGVVVSAMHLQLGERVAIKFLLPEHAKREDHVVRFLREAQASAKIRSEHVARVSDVGTLASGAPYMVMELLEGHDLARFAARGQRLDMATAVDYVLQASEAIAEAHGLGIVHRDLKPSNLFLSRRADGSPCIKVLDFGISKLLPSSSTSQSIAHAHLTKTQTVLGSPLYMSPEQMSSSKSVDARTDIWALGGILFQLLAGEPPFVAESMPELCAMILQQPVRSIRELRPDVPRAFEAVLFRCLAKERESRYAHIGELARALHPFAPPHAWISVERIVRLADGPGPTHEPEGVMRGVAAAPRASTGVATGSDGSWEQTAQTGSVGPSGARRRTWAVRAAIGLGGLLLVGAGFAALPKLRAIGARVPAPPAAGSSSHEIQLVLLEPSKPSEPLRTIEPPAPLASLSPEPADAGARKHPAPPAPARPTRKPNDSPKDFSVRE